MAAHKGNEYAKGNRGGARPTKYKPEYPGMVRKLCEKGFTDGDIAETLGISMSTLHQWKVRREEFYEALQRGKDEANRCVENSLFKRANGFQYETEKILHSGRRIKVTEHALPDVGAQRLWLQNRMPEVYREQKDTKHILSMDDAFLRFLEQMEEQAKLDRAQNARLIEHEPSTDMKSPERALEMLETRGVEETEAGASEDSDA